MDYIARNVADDEPAIVMAIRDELTFEGYDIETATTGPEALARTPMVTRRHPSQLAAVACEVTYLRDYVGTSGSNKR